MVTSYQPAKIAVEDMLEARHSFRQRTFNQSQTFNENFSSNKDCHKMCSLPLSQIFPFDLLDLSTINIIRWSDHSTHYYVVVGNYNCTPVIIKDAISALSVTY